MKKLITPHGWINVTDATCTYLDGGVLRVNWGDGNVDYISPAYWSAVAESEMVGNVAYEYA